MFLSERMIFAKVVKGPLVNMVILDPGTSDFTTESQISSASGCLSPG